MQASVAALTAGAALALAACGGSTTTTVIERQTVTQQAAATTSSTTTAPTTTTNPETTSTTTTTTTGSGPIPALNGSYGLQQTDHPFDGSLPNTPHDGLWNADTEWRILSGSCTPKSCQVRLRRLLSDSTIEDLTLSAKTPTGVYQGTIPGGDGKASCSGSTGSPVKLTMLVRVGGLQQVNGQTVATRLAGHIFADYACPGSAPTHDVGTYVGTRS